MADRPVGFARRRNPTVKEVQQKADEMDQRYRARIEEQKRSIDSFMAYLEQTDQVAAYIAWQNRNRKEGS